MPKRLLRKAGFKKRYLVSYYRQDDEEWMTFSGRIVSEDKETVIFYIKKGKIEDWIKPSKNLEKNTSITK